MNERTKSTKAKAKTTKRHLEKILKTDKIYYAEDL